MKRMKNVKILQNGVQLWVAIGGWTFNDAEQPTANVFSQLAASTSHQDSFANSLISMMNTYGFDGVDIDW
jgi:chitinase